MCIFVVCILQLQCQCVFVCFVPVYVCVCVVEGMRCVFRMPLRKCVYLFIFCDNNMSFFCLCFVINKFASCERRKDGYIIKFHIHTNRIFNSLTSMSLLSIHNILRSSSHCYGGWVKICQRQKRCSLMTDTQDIVFSSQQHFCTPSRKHVRVPSKENITGSCPTTPTREDHFQQSHHWHRDQPRIQDYWPSTLLRLDMSN